MKLSDAIKAEISETKEEFITAVNEYYKAMNLITWEDKKADLEQLLIIYKNAGLKNRVKWVTELLSTPVFTFDELL